MSTTSDDRPSRSSRKAFLGRLGLGAAAVGSGGLVRAESAAARTAHAQHAYSTSSDRFGRIFEGLPPFASQSPKVEEAMRDIGKPGGILDAKDALDKGPVLLITDPSLSAGNPNNSAHPAGATFMGQFLDHDMTFDVGSRLGQPTDPRDAVNGRTPAFDLDSVYGGGPVASAQLYDPADRAKLRLDSGGHFEDLPRVADGTAVIADPRNDEHVVIAGLQCAFILCHNRAVEEARGAGAADPFAQARRLVTWHYHWLILHELLPLFVGQALVDDVLTKGRRFYRPKGAALMPVEFQGAAYRFGHSMVRPSYRANLKGDRGKAFFGLIFDPAASGSDPVDLRGGCRAPRRFVGWQTFFDFGDGEVKPNKLIDTKLSTPLFDLPLGAIASGDLPTSLPQRNLLRQLTWKLPSGQRLAKEMGLPALAPGDLQELSGYGLKLERSTPLWYYVLKEAEVMAAGLRLGPVGGRIVAEVMIGLLQTDPASYVASQPGWKPTLPSTSGHGEFRMVDLLRYAGVDPASRGQ
ncbi:MAG: peroxidase [Actinobacteria bacterium]|nr:peroxidase [Actinomycetota bacterium]